MWRALRNRIDNMVARAVVKLIDNTKKMQEAQIAILTGETRSAERFQQYGFSSVPLAGAEAVVLFVAGYRDHALITNVDDRRYRPTTWDAGESGLYHFEGDFIRLKNGRIIEVVAGTALTVTAPTVTITASTKVRMVTPILEVTGEIKDRCDSDGKTMEQHRTVYDGHAHGNVQNGLGTTNPPNSLIG